MFHYSFLSSAEFDTQNLLSSAHTDTSTRVTTDRKQKHGEGHARPSGKEARIERVTEFSDDIIRQDLRAQDHS